MADISDVLTVLSSLAGAALYPDGTDQPSISGHPAMVYPGWPVPNQLNADLASGKSHVSIFPQPEERNTTRYEAKWETVGINAPTLTLTVDSSTVTIGGSVTTPQSCMVTVNGTAYSYKVLDDDTLDSIAAGMANLVTGATSDGPVVTFQDVHSMAAVVITTGTGVRQLRCQERLIRFTVWAPSPAARDAITKVVDLELATSPRLRMPDGTTARLVYKGSPVTDMLEKSQIYRRDLLYTVEYATTETGTFYTIGNNHITIGVSNGT
jgi:hypothetical protein